MEKRGLRGAGGAKKRRQGCLPHGSLTTYRTSITARDVSGITLLSSLTAELLPPGSEWKRVAAQAGPPPLCPAPPSELPLQGLLPAGSPL